MNESYQFTFGVHSKSASLELAQEGMECEFRIYVICDTLENAYKIANRRVETLCNKNPSFKLMAWTTIVYIGKRRV